jgi:hypothetical protein
MLRWQMLPRSARQDILRLEQRATVVQQNHKNSAVLTRLLLLMGLTALQHKTLFIRAQLELQLRILR